jgi:hypothetical protein
VLSRLGLVLPPVFERRTDALRHALAKRISVWAWVSSRADDEVVSANFTPGTRRLCESPLLTRARPP